MNSTLRIALNFFFVLNCFHISICRIDQVSLGYPIYKNQKIIFRLSLDNNTTDWFFTCDNPTSFRYTRLNADSSIIKSSINFSPELPDMMLFELTPTQIGEFQFILFPKNPDEEMYIKFTTYLTVNESADVNIPKIMKIVPRQRQYIVDNYDNLIKKSLKPAKISTITNNGTTINVSIKNRLLLKIPGTNDNGFIWAISSYDQEYITPMNEIGEFISSETINANSTGDFYFEIHLIKVGTTNIAFEYRRVYDKSSNTKMFQQINILNNLNEISFDPIPILGEYSISKLMTTLKGGYSYEKINIIEDIAPKESNASIYYNTIKASSNESNNITISMSDVLVIVLEGDLSNGYLWYLYENDLSILLPRNVDNLGTTYDVRFSNSTGIQQFGTFYFEFIPLVPVSNAYMEFVFRKSENVIANLAFNINITESLISGKNNVTGNISNNNANITSGNSTNWSVTTGNISNNHENITNGNLINSSVTIGNFSNDSENITRGYSTISNDYLNNSLTHDNYNISSDSHESFSNISTQNSIKNTFENLTLTGNNTISQVIPNYNHSLINITQLANQSNLTLLKQWHEYDESDIFSFFLQMSRYILLIVLLN